MGNVPGPQAVTVSGGSGEIAVRFTATATGVPTSVRIFAGNSQSARAGLAVATRPAVLVLDAGGRPVPGIAVSFRITEGGGSLVGSSTMTGADGVATVGQWRLGVSGVNTLDAVVEGTTLAGEPVTFVATTTPPGGFDVVVRFTEPPTPAEALAFAHAEVRWEQVITGDLPDGSIDVPAGTCGSGTPALNEVVDDVVILAAFHSTDGPGNVLAQAGPCLFRDANDDGRYQIGELPGVGIMIFDADDLGFLAQNDLLAAAVLHEMGHVLGLGSLWSDMGLLADPSLPPAGGTDPHFTGSAALAAFDAAGGAAYPGAKVPVENRGGSGTADVHWREVGPGQRADDWVHRFRNQSPECRLGGIPGRPGLPGGSGPGGSLHAGHRTPHTLEPPARGAPDRCPSAPDEGVRDSSNENGGRGALPPLSGDGGAGNRTLVRVSARNHVYVRRLGFLPSPRVGAEPTSPWPSS